MIDDGGGDDDDGAGDDDDVHRLVKSVPVVDDPAFRSEGAQHVDRPVAHVRRTIVPCSL